MIATPYKKVHWVTEASGREEAGLCISLQFLQPFHTGQHFGKNLGLVHLETQINTSLNPNVQLRSMFCCIVMHLVSQLKPGWWMYSAWSQREEEGQATSQQTAHMHCLMLRDLIKKEIPLTKHPVTHRPKQLQDHIKHRNTVCAHRHMRW